MRRLLLPLLVVLIGGITLWQQPAGINRPVALPDAGQAQNQNPNQNRSQRRDPSGLPAEALDTLALIERGGPFPYRQDGKVFGNREGLLPDAAHGHYREYTVPTPGAADRGARRIVTGGDPPTTWYYTSDHYRSFRSITPQSYPLP